MTDKALYYGRILLDLAGHDWCTGVGRMRDAIYTVPMSTLSFYRLVAYSILHALYEMSGSSHHMLNICISRTIDPTPPDILTGTWNHVSGIPHGCCKWWSRSWLWRGRASAPPFADGTCMYSRSTKQMERHQMTAVVGRDRGW